MPNRIPPPPMTPIVPNTGLLARYLSSQTTPTFINHLYSPFKFTNHTSVDRGNGFFDFPLSSGQAHLRVLADGVYKLRVNFSIETDVDTPVLTISLCFIDSGPIKLKE